MPADIVELSKGIVEVLEASVADPNVPVERVRYSLQDLGKLTGKKIEVHPLGYADNGPADRKSNFFDVMITVVYMSKYGESGTPTAEWLDEQDEYVEDKIFNLLTDSRLSIELPDDVGYWPESASLNMLPKYLRENHVYYAELEMVFRREKPGIRSTLTIEEES